MKHFLISILLLFLCLNINAQNIVVKDIIPMTDIMEYKNQRKDANGSICAVIRIFMPKKETFFEGNVIGDVEYRNGEYWIYLSPGSKFIRIKYEGCDPVLVNFTNYGVKGVNAKTFYDIKIDLSKLVAITPEEAYQKGYKALHEKDYASAIKNLTYSANSGFGNAQYQLGLIYLEGKGIPKDIVLAEKWLELASNNGIIQASNKLGDLYLDGNLKPKDNEHPYSKSTRLYYRGSKKGDSYSHFKLGWLCLVFYKNIKNAEDHYEKASLNHDYELMYKIGYTYDGTSASTLNLSEAIKNNIVKKWYERASPGSAAASFKLGEMFYSGREGIPMDKSLAETYLLRSIEKGGKGGVIVGNIYREKKEYEKAFYYYKKEAERGDNSWAMFLTGEWYINGWGTPRNRQEGIRWLKKSASMGRSDALKKLKEMNVAY